LKKQKAMRDAEFLTALGVLLAQGRLEDAHVIEAEPGSQINAFNKTWKAAVSRAGYPDLLFHDLRRSAVRNMVQKRVSLNLKNENFRPQNLSMFLRYNIVDREA